MITSACTRSKCVAAFKNALTPQDATKSTEIMCTAIAMELERQVYIHTAPADYMERIVHIKYNMSSSSLVDYFELDTLTPEDVYRFRCVNGSLIYSLCGIERFAVNSNAKSAWTQQHQQAALTEELIDLIIKDDTGTDATTNRSSIRCARCYSYDIEIDCKQTRSADEPMTVFCVCLNPDCRATWRGRS